MKKLFILAIMALCTLTSNAQLKVDSLGNTHFDENGINNSRLIVGKKGTLNYRTTIESLNSGGLYLYNDTSSHSQTHYLQYNNLISRGGSYNSAYALYSRATGIGQNTVRGIVGLAGGGKSCVGVLGSLYGSNGSSYSVGVLGSTTGSGSLLNVSNGVYAGYFIGNVRVTGTIYGTLLTPSSTSSSNANLLSTNSVNNRMSVTDKFQQVDLLQMTRINQDGSLAANKSVSKVHKQINSVDKTTQAEDELTEEESEIAEEPIQTKLSDISYSLAADQLKEVYPELVYEDSEGNYSINYIEMVPLLVQSIKELSAEIAILKGESSKSTKKAKSATTGIEDTNDDVDIVRMDQNKPNPFSGSTMISLNIPKRTKEANIYVYDMSGKQVQSIAVPERGQTNITVYASSLRPGMFIYNLIVDGKVRASRKMIVTE